VAGRGAEDRRRRHAPQWETPLVFDALIEAFADECGG